MRGSLQVGRGSSSETHSIPAATEYHIISYHNYVFLLKGKYEYNHNMANANMQWQS